MYKILESLSEMPDLFENTGVFTDPEFAEAAVGYTIDGRIIYDYEKMILSYMAESLNKPYVTIMKNDLYWMTHNKGDVDPVYDNADIIDFEDFMEAMEEARDVIDYDTIRSIPYMGDEAPIIMYTNPRPWDWYESYNERNTDL